MMQWAAGKNIAEYQVEKRIGDLTVGFVVKEMAGFADGHLSVLQNKVLPTDSLAAAWGYGPLMARQCACAFALTLSQRGREDMRGLSQQERGY